MRGQLAGVLQGQEDMLRPHLMNLRADGPGWLGLCMLAEEKPRGQSPGVLSAMVSGVVLGGGEVPHSGSCPHRAIRVFQCFPEGALSSWLMR